MKVIYPTNIKIPILIDDINYDDISKHTWYLSKRGYACRSVWLNGKNATEYMHRRILKPADGFDAEHIDRNRLNNQKSNLRPSTRSQNMANVRKIKSESAQSKYKGVSRLNRVNLRNQWLAYIKLDYKMYYLGYFNTEEEAAHMYNQFAEQIYGEFASLNEI